MGFNLAFKGLIAITLCRGRTVTRQLRDFVTLDLIPHVRSSEMVQ